MCFLFLFLLRKPFTNDLTVPLDAGMAKKRRAGGGGGRRGGGGGAGSGDEEDRASEGSFESETSSMLSNGSTVRSEKASEDSHHPTDFMESLELLGEKR